MKNQSVVAKHGNGPVEFRVISPQEKRFEYRGHSFLLKAVQCGWVHSPGVLINLYRVKDAFDRQYLKAIGWHRNGSNQPAEDLLIPGRKNITWQQAQKAVIEYIDAFLGEE